MVRKNVDNRTCLRSTQVSICFPFALSSLGRHPPPLPLKFGPHVCGQGGAGACCPEDRGSAGSQKHLSVPLPLHCNPPGTALSQPAPAVCKCVWLRAFVRCILIGWMNEKQVCLTVVCVHECVSACLSFPLNTPF